MPRGGGSQCFAKRSCYPFCTGSPRSILPIAGSALRSLRHTRDSTRAPPAELCGVSDTCGDGLLQWMEYGAARRLSASDNWTIGQSIPSHSSCRHANNRRMCVFENEGGKGGGVGALTNDGESMIYKYATLTQRHISKCVLCQPRGRGLTILQTIADSPSHDGLFQTMV